LTAFLRKLFIAIIINTIYYKLQFIKHALVGSNTEIVYVSSEIRLVCAFLFLATF